MRHVRDQLVEAICTRLRTAIPGFEGRVFAEGSGYLDDAGTLIEWDEKSYPTATVFSGATRVFPISQHAGYRLARREQEFSVALGVREYDGEDPLEALSGLLAAVEDAVLAVEEEAFVESIDVRSISHVAQSDDDDGGISATVIGFAAEYYTQHGISGEFVAG